MLSYEEALNFIHGLNKFGVKLGLDNITSLLDILGNPHRGMKIIHVAGTNGKGSTCAMLDSILRAAGYKVGLYTSPYLEVFNERMRVNGQNITDLDLVRIAEKVRDAVFYMREQGIGSPTEFEVVTAIGFLYFREKAVDFLVLEVGMGGRLDATNVATPMVSVITPISYDHQQYLGNTLADIAREKCGIIKEGVPVVTGPQEPEAMEVIEETCKARRCSLVRVVKPGIEKTGNEIRYKVLRDEQDGLVFDLETPKSVYRRLEIKLMGAHQFDNAAAAVGAVEALSLYGVHISREAVYSGLRDARWPGRLEILRKEPTVLIDGAHNIAGVKTLVHALEKYFYGRRKILVMGVLKDKDYEDMIAQILPYVDTAIATLPDSPRALPAGQLAEAMARVSRQVSRWGDREGFRERCVGETDSSSYKINIFSRDKIADAVNLAFELALPEDVIVFAGSLYMIGSVRTLLK